MHRHLRFHGGARHAQLEQRPRTVKWQTRPSRQCEENKRSVNQKFKMSLTGGAALSMLEPRMGLRTFESVRKASEALLTFCLKQQQFHLHRLQQ